jgi:DNA-directed RNA polymerase specialized sigma24 family protein
MEEGKTHLAEVFEREKARFLGFVRRQLDGFSGMDAEDIVGDVIYRLLRQADMVEEVEILTAYIYRSLANRITDLRRKSVPPVSLDHGGEDDGDASQAIQPEHPGPDPEEVCHQAQLREQLRVALRTGETVCTEEMDGETKVIGYWMPLTEEPEVYVHFGIGTAAAMAKTSPCNQ